MVKKSQNLVNVVCERPLIYRWSWLRLYLWHILIPGWIFQYWNFLGHPNKLLRIPKRISKRSFTLLCFDSKQRSTFPSHKKIFRHSHVQKSSRENLSVNELVCCFICGVCLLYRDVGSGEAGGDFGPTLTSCPPRFLDLAAPLLHISIYWFSEPLEGLKIWGEG